MCDLCILHWYNKNHWLWLCEYNNRIQPDANLHHYTWLKCIKLVWSASTTRSPKARYFHCQFILLTNEIKLMWKFSLSLQQTFFPFFQLFRLMISTSDALNENWGFIFFAINKTTTHFFSFNSLFFFSFRILLFYNVAS